jgi:hypothetical protein
VIHGDEKKKVKVSFYEMKKNTPILISTLTDKTTNNVFWSPNGKFCVLGIHNS